jgi:hypothetical protein
VPATLHALVSAGHLGRKSGRGFLNHDHDPRGRDDSHHRDAGGRHVPAAG